MEEIGGDIDLCLLDTAHCNPGEFLDFLIILPYLKKNAVLILHDTCLYAGGKTIYTTNAVLLSCLKGEKFSFNENLFSQYANIAAVVLDEQQEKLFDYLYLLTLPWSYLPSDDDIFECCNLFKKNYGENFADRFLKIMLSNKRLFLRETAKGKIKHKLMKIFVGLIPSRKIRQKIYPYH